jgi:hypothetical protein
MGQKLSPRRESTRKMIHVVVYFYTNMTSNEKKGIVKDLPDRKPKLGKTAWKKGVIRVRTNDSKGIHGAQVHLNRNDDFRKKFNELLRKCDITLVDWDEKRYFKTAV